jgi:hypothetical protein
MLKDLRPEYLLWSAGVDRPSLLHQQNMVCELRGEVDVVSDDERCCSVLVAAISDEGQQRRLM